MISCRLSVIWGERSHGGVVSGLNLEPERLHILNGGIETCPSTRIQRPVLSNYGLRASNEIGNGSWMRNANLMSTLPDGQRCKRMIAVICNDVGGCIS